MNESEKLRGTTAEMATLCTVPMRLWDRHSNACLATADALDAAHAEIARLTAKCDATLTAAMD